MVSEIPKAPLLAIDGTFRTPAFRAAAHRQSIAVAKSAMEKEHQGFINAASA